MTAASTVRAPRIAASPYARRLARERGIALDRLPGSGPGGRIVAADLAHARVMPAVAEAPVATLRLSALATSIQLATMFQLLGGFAATETAFTLEDVALRAVGCALDDVPDASRLEGAPVALETNGQQRVFDHIRKNSLGPLRARRIAAGETDGDQRATPADISLRLLPAGDIRPVLMPLLAGRNLRLVLAVGDTSAEALLSFDAGIIAEDTAATMLGRFKAYLEQPLRLLA